MTLLKSLFTRTAPPALQPSTPAAGVAVAPPRAASGQRHVWEALSASDGVQLEDYPDVPRLEMQPFLDPAPKRVLDLGCGTGATGLWIKTTYGAWVWGCEPNAWTAQRALQRLDHLSTDPSDDWSAEDVALLGTVDTVLLLDVLEHMYNPWAQLQFLARHLRRDARVVVSLPNAGHASVLHQLASGTFQYAQTGILDVTHIRFFTRDEMRRMFEQTGFVVEKEAPINATATTELTSFPCTVDFGPLLLRVETLEQWQQVNAVQFGFRLRLK